MFNRGRRKSIATFVTLLIVGIMAACFFFRKAQEREEFVGNVDPKSGYRGRFTLSPDWKLNAAESQSRSAPGYEFDVFHPTMNPTRQWIEDHILHRPTANAPTISLAVTDIIQNKIIGRRYRIVEGYPDLARRGRVQVVTQRHLHVDGYPATFLNIRGAIPSDRFRESLLMVYVPDRSLLYAVFGSGDTSNIAQTDREMQAIISSFHIEKVLPADGKQ